MDDILCKLYLQTSQYFTRTSCHIPIIHRIVLRLKSAATRGAIPASPALQIPAAVSNGAPPLIQPTRDQESGRSGEAPVIDRSSQLTNLIQAFERTQTQRQTLGATSYTHESRNRPVVALLLHAQIR